MTSVGIMASSVVPAAGTDVLMEPFNNLTAWTTIAGSPAVVAGRTGTALSVSGATAATSYNITAPNRSTWLTVGFAFRTSTLITDRIVMALWTDVGLCNQLRVLTTGAIDVIRTDTSAVLAASATGLVAINTYYYLELQIFLADSGGSVVICRNGVQVAANLSVDTKSSSGTLYQQLRIGPAGSGFGQLYDDLYLTMGAGAVFKGDITIP